MADLQGTSHPHHLHAERAATPPSLALRDQRGRPLYVRTSGGNIRRALKPPRSVERRIRHEVLIRDDFTCQSCWLRADEESIGWFLSSGWTPLVLQLDHVIPYRSGGLFTVQNLQTLCVPCNGAKGCRVPS